MFRNVESHFAKLPQAKIKRSSMPLEHTHLTTFNAGELVPFFVQEVLPGDTFTYDMATLVRLTTSLHPTMDNCYLDTYFFYIPNRLLWDNWQHFMGENDQPWANNNTYVVPNQSFSSGSSVQVGSVLNYLGVPAGSFSNLPSGYNLTFSCLPFNAYIKVWNDWFRDQNLQSEVPISKVDGSIASSYWNAYSAIAGAAPNFAHSCLPVAKFHDYFTSALPAPQKGPDVLIPSGGEVVFNADGYDPSVQYPTFKDAAGNIANAGDIAQYNSASFKGIGITGGGQAPLIYDPAGTLNLSGLEITVNNLRLAIQTQRLLEKDARGGTRYIELIKSHFGVNSPDARLQRSEYLGGKRIPINMLEVTQTSESSSGNPLGKLAGKSVTADSSNMFTKSFVEHGFLLGVCCVRSDHTYAQGLDKMFFRTDRLDYYWPVFAHLGEQPILNKEIKANCNNPDEVFGYQEAWAEYRFKPNRISGLFSPQVSGNLSSWTYCDYYDTATATAPVLSDSWLRQGTSEIDRTLVDTSAIVPQFLADFYIKGKMVRPMPVYSIPGLMDHD